MNKQCSKCNNIYPSDYFHKNKKTKDGFHYQCKYCNRSYKSNNNYHKRNRNRQRQYNKQYYINNQQHIKEQTRLYRHDNKEWKSLYDKEYGRKWRKSNADRVRSHAMKRITKKITAMPAWADEQKIQQIYQYCHDMSKQDGIEYQVDHVVPLQGLNVCGLHVENNLQIITATENRNKWNRFCDDS